MKKIYLILTLFLCSCLTDSNIPIEGTYVVSSDIEQNNIYLFDITKNNENSYTISNYNKDDELMWTKEVSKRTDENILTWNDSWLGCEFIIEGTKADLILGGGANGKIEFTKKHIEEYKPPTTNLNFLKSYNGKYPYDVKLFENIVIKDRIIKLIGNEKYLDLVSKWEVETPIIIEDGIFKANACQAHSCGSDEAFLIADINKNIIYLRILRNGKSKIFSEDGARLNHDFFSSM